MSSDEESSSATMKKGGRGVHGHVPGFPPGSTFSSRKELLAAGVHGMIRAGIHGCQGEAAFSICLSGGYEDNKDMGDKIIYVGSGGRNPAGEQTGGQSMSYPPNKSLQNSCERHQPVRVIRGADKRLRRTSLWSPTEGYRYDGLYVVDKCEEKPGKRGFNMCFFELKKIREEEEGNGDTPVDT